MRWANRKVRMAIVLAIAVVVAVVAWRTGQDERCVPGRKEIRDESGKVTKIERKECY